MINNTDKICQRARELALQHTPTVMRVHPKYIWNQFESDIESLRDFVFSLQNSPASCALPAEEWLLDNAEFIEEQAIEVKANFSNRSFDYLPSFQKKGTFRIQTLCEDYLEQVDGILDEETLASYLNAYQEVSALRLAETCAISLILRMTLIGRLSETMSLVRERREICVEVEQLFSRIEPSKLNPETINAILDEAEQKAPLSGPWIVHLISHLREWAEDSATVREWLVCKLENSSIDLDRIVSYELQLQSAFQVKAGNLISSLRKNERMDWDNLFERICLLDQTLRQDRTDDYSLLDSYSRNEILNRVEKLAHRLRLPENLIASHAVALSKVENEQWGDEQRNKGIDPPRSTFVAYFLFDPAGIKKLEHSLRLCSETRPVRGTGIAKRATGTYLTLLIGLFVLALLATSAWIGGARSLTPVGWGVVLLMLSLPVSEWVITWLHFGIERTIRPRPLLRYDFSNGVPSTATTMVVIPAIWSTTEEAEELTNRLEIHYLANRDPNIHYALLGDFTDAAQETLQEDHALVAFTKERIATLNGRYAIPEGATFHFFQRRRKWNPAEEVFMGWERKRGKLVEFVELLKGSKETSFESLIGDGVVLPPFRYIITLDADTQLPMGSAQRMIGTLHLPYNRPRLNQARTRVVEGYGVLQPRIGTSYESAMQSRFAYICSEPGLDPYAFAASDPYQDAMEQGIFTGKGIFDVDTFAELLCERIPENTVLSHDLLEGGFLRAALLSDVELIDNHPASFLSYQQRMHRWVRGDWQMLCWLFPRVCDRRGALRPVDLSAITRWQMIDNLRRSLLPIIYLLILALGFSVLPGSSVGWVVFILVTMLLPMIRQLVHMKTAIWHPRRVLSTGLHVLINILTLPFQSAVLLDAIGKTLYRLSISKRRMLEWTSSSQIERRNRGKQQSLLLGASGGYGLIILFACAVAMQQNTGLRWMGFTLCLIWALAPIAVRWLNQPIAQEELQFTAVEEDQMRVLAKQIWEFYEDYAGPKDHFLPPDNVQMDPPNGVAHRTSPTNIGFLLTASLAARDFGFIDTPELVERLERTVGTVEKLDKWNGHLYNWYDTLSLGVLPPAYVSTVDSGNFVASLMTVKQGLAHWLKTDFTTSKQRFSSDISGNLGLNVEFSVDLDQTSPEEMTHLGLEDHLALNQAKKDSYSSPQVASSDWVTLGYKLMDRLEALIIETDFRPLYDYKAKLFVLGYHASSNQRDNILYDLLASEARQTSFVAIALGQVSVSHWLALGRTAKRQGNQTTLVSWSGTMFEYLMPSLIMRSYRNSIWASTYRGVVNRQIEYARERGVPFGISESGYYAFDYQMNYQYRAFGVPGLGFKRGLEQDLVLAPYATVMALPFALREGLNDLLRMEKLGARGKYGFYEAIDFTPGRMPEGDTCKIIQSFMAHHQGMSLLTLANVLLPSKMYDHFHRDKRVQAAELLLQERIPSRDSIIKRELSGQSRIEKPKPAHIAPLREYDSADTAVPEVNVHSNGSLTAMISNSGSGFIRFEGMDVTRWREDPVTDQWGSYMYIRDVASDKVWSPTFQPCRQPSRKQRVQFSQERSTFLSEEEDVHTTLDICVSPEANAEVRRLTLSNKGSEARIIEVTTFLEIALAPHDADKAHPAFTKLFIETQFDADTECLLARKRPRDGGEKSVWAFHTLTTGDKSLGPVEYETDRARFVGRGYKLSRPSGIATRLGGTVGSVADPAFIMRRRITLQPGERVELTALTGVAESKEQAIDMVEQLSMNQQVERSFQLAWTRSQIEMQHLHITIADLAVFQLLAGRTLYTAPLNPERANSIAVNQKGQQGLWAYGISGDLPIVMIQVEDTMNLSFVNKLIVGFEYLRHNRLFIDLVILNESVEGYQQDLQDALRRMVEQIVGGQAAGQGSVHILPASQLVEGDRSLLFAVSRIVLRADGPSLKAQLKAFVPNHTLAELVPITASTNRFAPAKPVETNDLLFFNGWGGFTADGREYHIVLKNGNYLPAPWINVMANPKFGCMTSELYTGYTWWRNSRECKLTPWSNDPAIDQPGEVCFLRDEESMAYWSLTSAREQMDSTYKVVYGRGYTRYLHESHGLQQEMTVYVPLNDPVKVIKLRLYNNTSEQRRLSATYYAEWVLGVHREGNASFIVTDWDPENEVLMARNTYQENFRDATAFLTIHPAASVIPNMDLSWTADRLEFIGRNGSLDHPAVMDRLHLSGATGPTYEGCGAIQTKFVIEPNSEQIVYIILGCEDSRESVVQLTQKYRQSLVCDQAFEDVIKFWDDAMSTITVSTPCPEMDIMLNNWLLYQTLSCRMWARSAFYQAGGAYGFRDQLQDSLALLHSRPDLTRAQILLHASHQYEEGDVQHWWHEETHRGIRTRFSDDLLWLPYAVVRYMEHTEDESLLNERVPFLRSEPLGEKEHERYEPTVLSEQSGTIFEHCLRALDRGLRFGEHGLPLIGIGDWNDGMSRVGAEGRGESVWLGWFLGNVLQGMAELSERRGENERAANYLHIQQKLADSLNEKGWDGQWYRRAFTDAGQWLGSIHNAECQIDAIAQSWSVISGMAQPDKALQAMRSFDRELVDRSLSVAHILYPPFDQTDPSPGYIQGYPPGIRENGGQYTHGVLWSIIAWCGLGEGDKAFELFHMLNPIMHTKTSSEVRKYVGEPYVMSADVYTEEPHKGHAGWTWYTGASGWMYQAGIEWIIGLRRRGERLYIRPCMPKEWPEFAANYRFGSTVYHITVKNPSQKSSGQTTLSMDGKDADMKKFTIEEGPYILLHDDSESHQIVLSL
ncbi:glycosyl transferase family 36 [Paenibacillus pectinilyticus]|uniref:Glycosyl transferase family 36 n=1 Tax=Paenibacillus pectinilyticus TaxID=512399 RepID=A0A1C1A109_9BACL|nr:glucoamylase family protein [Paenibacillus pectinilyticus]OCT14008.1 glycosyl transferase family 36 [Paenibacillus pectinilyticus]